MNATGWAFAISAVVFGLVWLDGRRHATVEDDHDRRWADEYAFARTFAPAAALFCTLLAALCWIALEVFPP